MDACDGLEFVSVEKVGLDGVTVPGPWAWDARLNQLSPGCFHNKMQILRSPDLTLHEQYWQRSVEVIANTSKYAVMIGTSLNWREARLEWYGIELDNRHISGAAPGSPVDFKTPDDGRHIVMQIKPESLIEALGREAFYQLLDKRCVVFRAIDGERLIALMSGIIRNYANNPALVEDQFYFRTQKSLLLKVLGDCIANTHQNEPVISGTRRKIAVRNAIRHVEKAERPLTVLELAMAAKVSQRTLTYAFKEGLDMTPAAYLRIQRLNAAHRELLTVAPAETTVTSIALKWGFNHPGRFSAMHRKMFNETPSTTLGKTGQ